MESIAKAYGKILVFGAYSILEPGNIGLVVNIDKGTTATAQETTSGNIVIDLSNFEIVVYGKIEGNRLILEKDPEILRYIKNAVDYSFQYLNYKKVRVKDLKLISYNDPELYINKKLKTGFGSSATVTVSTVAAILKLHDIDDKDLVYKLSKYSHYKSQGKLGSGFDISAACYGSQYFIAKPIDFTDNFIKYIESDDIPIFESFIWPLELFPVIIFTGSSASTEELIEKVMLYKRLNPEEYKDFIHKYNQINLALKNAIDENFRKRIKFFLEESWAMRRELGKITTTEIEPEKFTSMMQEMKKNGAMTAGLIGAGGGDSIIALCESEDNKAQLIEYLKRKKLTVFENVNIMSQGYEILR